MARILVADDNVHVVETMAEILMYQNHVVEKAYDGQEALDKAKLSSPDLIFLDVEMPYINGIDVCRKLRATKETQLTPIVILTGLDDTGILIEAIQAGCDDFLSKPADIPVLEARVKSLLKMSQLRNQIREKERFEYMIHHMSEGIIVTDKSGIIQKCNSMAAQMLMIDSHHLPSIPILSIIDRTFKWKPLDWFVLLKNRKGEFSIFRREENYRIRYALKLKYDTLLNPFSEIDEVIFLINEETERFNEERRKDLLVSLMTHKFGTIESITLMNLESLQQLIKSPDPEFKTTVIQGLRESSHRMTTVMKSLLQFLKLPENFREKKLESVTNDWLHVNLEKIKQELGMSDLTIQIRWSDFSSFYFIEGGLYRILFELIENAIKFGDRNDLGLEVSITLKKEEKVILSVFNRGKPIPQEELNRVWDRFYQIDPEFTGQVEGIGLGLSIVEYIIQLSRGTSQIFSDKSGTRVELEFPYISG